jgi:hypothetical protein
MCVCERACVGVFMCVCERVCVGVCMCVCECLKTHMNPCQLVFTDIWEELAVFMFKCKDNSFWVCLLVLD